MPERTIALVGNPNCGKTTLFNALTGANQRVGNWPGVTVDRKEGRYRYGDQTITVIDLPGVYAIDAEDDGTALDERVARDYLATGEADLVVNILDAANLERNLYLTLQILEMRSPTLLALNMMDVAQERGLQIDVAQLSQRLGCPVVPLVAARGQGLEALRAAIQPALEQPTLPQTYVPYPAVIEDAIAALEPAIAALKPTPSAAARWLALRLLEYDDQVVPGLNQATLVQQVAEQRRRIHQVLAEDLDILVADSRYGFAHNLLQSVVQRPRQVSPTASDRIDQVVLNRWLGIPVFLLVMYLLFLVAINVGSAFMDCFDRLVGAIAVDGLGAFLNQLGAPDWMRVLLAEGLGGGVQTVATFIPVISCLFLFLALLEDSGYMARAAFVMDRFMRLIGLPGKSFVPMLIGFGCNVPAIMATRTLENPRDRILTILMNPFMSCGARLPVYALFAAAFFPLGGQNVVFLLYLIGIGAAIFTGLVMKHTLLAGEAAPFVLELPPYHIPTLRGVLLRTWDRLRSFVVRAGRVIVLMVLVLSLLNALSLDGSLSQAGRQDSILSAIGQGLTPLFAPMGIQPDNWPATVGLFSGIFAKEAVVGALDSLYTQLGNAAAIASGGDPASADWLSQIQAAFATIPANLTALSQSWLDPFGLGAASNPQALIAAEGVSTTTFGQMLQRFDGQAGAFAYLLFVLMYFPCVSAMGAVYRETNLGWTLFVGCWTTGLAYGAAVLFYQIATFQRHPLSATLWIGGVFLVMAGVIGTMRVWRSQRRQPTAVRQN